MTDSLQKETAPSRGNGRDGGSDWDVAQARPMATRPQLDAGVVSQERIDAILSARARQFARVPDAEEEGERLDLMVVRLGTELYGLDAQLIFRVRPATDVAFVPRVPLWVDGIVNERGRILSVINLGRFLGMSGDGEEGGSSSHSRSLVIVEVPEMELAFLADELLSVISLPVSYVKHDPDVVRGITGAYVRGVVGYQALASYMDLTAVSDTEQTLVILDVRTLLTDERLIVEEQIA